MINSFRSGPALVGCNTEVFCRIRDLVRLVAPRKRLCHHSKYSIVLYSFWFWHSAVSLFCLSIVVMSWGNSNRVLFAQNKAAWSSHSQHSFPNVLWCQPAVHLLSDRSVWQNGSIILFCSDVTVGADFDCGPYEGITQAILKMPEATLSLHWPTRDNPEVTKCFDSAVWFLTPFVH